MLPRGNRYQLFATLGIFISNTYCCFFFAAKERLPEILVELNLSYCDILESSIFFCAHIVHLYGNNEV